MTAPRRESPAPGERADAPATPTPRARRVRPEPPPRGTRRPVDDGPVVPNRSEDDGDQGWGEREPSSRDDELRRDVPPHW